MGEWETVTAGAWHVDNAGDWVRDAVPSGASMACVWVASGIGWTVWASLDQGADPIDGWATGQAGRDAADAALRAAGVVLL